MATVSSGTSLSANYFLRKFYESNRDAIKGSTRNNYSSSELSYEDARALHRAAKALDNYGYDENDNKENVNATIKALVSTYNIALDSTKKGDSPEVERYTRRLKNLMKQYSDEFEDIGVTFKADGKLSCNDNLLKSSKIDTVKEIFGKDSGFTRQLKQISKGLNTASLNDIYTALTGKGQQINITL